MTDLPFVLNAALLMTAFGFTDRFNGGGFGWRRLTVDHGGPLHGRGIYYAALPLLGLCWLLGGLPGLWIALIWGVYRAAFGFPTGTLTGRDMRRTVIRHAIILPPILFVMIGCHRDPAAVLPFVAYVAAAVALAKWDGDAIKAHGDINGNVETARGTLFGLALAVALELAR